MKIAKYTPLIIIFTVLLNSCRPDPIDINIDEMPQRLVISSQVIPNEIMIITVSKSFSALAFSQENQDSISNDIINELLVEDAEVIISYNGLTDTLDALPGIPGVYVSLDTPQFINSDYDLKVYDPQIEETVTAQTNMLEQVMFNSVTASATTPLNINSVNVEFEFDDPEDEENWYMINFYDQSNSDIENGSPFSANSNISTETLLLSDKTFENSNYRDEFELFDWEEDSVIVSISNINEDYFDYLTIRQRSGNLFSDLVKEPINYPTNVVGGYGFFTAFFPDIKLVVVEP